MTSESLAELGPDSIVGSYRLVKEIGRGGMGSVWEAAHVILPRRAAIKELYSTVEEAKADITGLWALRAGRAAESVAVDTTAAMPLATARLASAFSSRHMRSSNMATVGLA